MRYFENKNSLPAYLVDLGSTIEPNVIVITPSAGYTDPKDLPNLGNLHSKRLESGKPANPTPQQEPLSNQQDDVFDSFVPTSIPVSNLSVPESVISEPSRFKFASDAESTAKEPKVESLLHEIEKVQSPAVLPSEAERINKMLVVLDSTSGKRAHECKDDMEFIRKKLKERVERIFSSKSNSVVPGHMLFLEPAFKGVRYTVCASNQVMSGKAFMALKDVNQPKPKDASTSNLEPLVLQAHKNVSSFTKLRRLTVILDDSTNNCNLNGSNAKLKPYDILAARPLTEKAFQQCCQQHEIDIISLDMTARIPFFLKATTVNMAIQRGIVFEICYSPAIRDPIARRNTISNAIALLRVTNHRNIIISSEAASDMELRGPYDVINLASLFGLNGDQARYCMTNGSRQVLLHAAARKITYKCVLTQEATSGVLETQPWKLGEKPKDEAFGSDFLSLSNIDDSMMMDD
ncbi:hypothetical protein HDU67_009020 [Dinochytrium kinnereticum]|nr:hypothetical protein HDU67_009020 [Dinochytrium kinnereticum]